MKTSPLLLALALFLSACATAKPKPEPVVKEASSPPHEIKIASQPSGAIIDLNGNFIGVSPVTLVIQPSKYRHSWPVNGLYYQVIRARWTNGASRIEAFDTTAPLPDNVILM